MNELRRTVSYRVRELEQEEMKQQCKIALNGNIRFKKRYEDDLKSIAKAKNLNQQILNELMRA